MMTYQEINEFLSHFNTNSYNRSQIGNNKHLIITIYEYLIKLNVSKETAETLISNIAYLSKDNLNISLYLEILSKSIGYINEYDLKDIIKVTKDIHDIYYKNTAKYDLDDYIHDTNEVRMNKLFLNRNNKYLEKVFENNDVVGYLCDLKLIAAMELEKADYKEFIGFLESFQMYKDNYSPLLVIKTYEKLRSSLKDLTRLFWDIYFGNEYLVALNKNNIQVDDIYHKNIFKYNSKPKKELAHPVQLDLFSYQDVSKKEPEIKENVDCLQICSIYNTSELPEFEEEQDLLMYYRNLLDDKRVIILPKLKNDKRHTYIYELN